MRTCPPGLSSVYAANRSDSSLADDLRQADFLLLTPRYDGWNQPSASTRSRLEGAGAGRSQLLLQIREAGVL